MVGIQSRMPCGSPGMPIVSSPMRNCSWPRMKDAPCGAALLPIGIGENRALGGDTIDVGRAITHRAHGVGAVLRNADVVTEVDEDVRRLAGACRRLLLSLRAAHGPRSPQPPLQGSYLPEGGSDDLWRWILAHCCAFQHVEGPCFTPRLNLCVRSHAGSRASEPARIIGRRIRREKLDLGATRRPFRRRFDFRQHPNGRTKAQELVMLYGSRKP
ncbi:hypothetical protein FB001_102254 [Ensifer sp. SEMIA 135]|nr:hypothetical protein FB000_101235 [Ensifer sp. SEMIA 134]TWB40349.1 hypothetical protein FB001_102254 [Ensifer sp. SEMIA 135]